MSTLNKLAQVFVAAALIAGQHALAQVPTEPITIKRILANGTGCPMGTVAKNISDDKQAFSLTFSDFVAETGPGLSPSSARKNCVVTVTFKVPTGWQYSIGSFFYRGYMGLDRGVVATHRTSYFFEGQGQTGTFESYREGPLQEDFVMTDKVGLSSVVIPDTWSPCNADRALNINASILVRNLSLNRFPTARGLITNDSIDGQVKQVYGLSWRRCR